MVTLFFCFFAQVCFYEILLSIIKFSTLCQCNSQGHMIQSIEYLFFCGFFSFYVQEGLFTLFLAQTPNENLFQAFNYSFLGISGSAEYNF